MVKLSELVHLDNILVSSKNGTSFKTTIFGNLKQRVFARGP